MATATSPRSCYARRGRGMGFRLARKPWSSAPVWIGRLLWELVASCSGACACLRVLKGQSRRGGYRRARPSINVRSRNRQTCRENRQSHPDPHAQTEPRNTLSKRTQSTQSTKTASLRKTPLLEPARAHPEAQRTVPPELPPRTVPPELLQPELVPNSLSQKPRKTTTPETYTGAQAKDNQALPIPVEATR